MTNVIEKTGDKYLADFDPWYTGFEKYLLDNYLDNVDDLYHVREEFFHEKLTQYLFSPKGGRYLHLFEFDFDYGNETELACGQIAPRVKVKHKS